MSVALDNHAAASMGTGGTVTTSFTVGAGSNRLLVCMFATVGGAGLASAPTYAGVTMTQLGANLTGGTGGTARSIYVYYLLNPTSGANNISVTWDATTGTGREVFALSFTGVDQVTPFGTPVTSVTAGATVSGTVSSAVTGMVFSGVNIRGTVNPTATGTSQTRQDAAIFNSNGSGATSTQPGAASVTASWSWSPSDNEAFMVAAINAVATTAASFTPENRLVRRNSLLRR